MAAGHAWLVWLLACMLCMFGMHGLHVWHVWYAHTCVHAPKLQSVSCVCSAHLQLGEALNLTLPPDEVRKYKLFKYTMEQRVYPALQTLKACDSVAQSREYHIVHALLSPRPEDKMTDQLSK
eukprot:999732-Prymnesium_polylepis.2